jgi:hypothetical protein
MKRLHVALLVTGLFVVPGAILLFRGNAKPGNPSTVLKPARKAHSQAGYFAPPKEAPPPASTEEISQASETVRLKSTFRNYRTAVATGNERLSAALKRVLLRDRREALKLAREELSRSTDGQERELAQKTLESLESKP